MHSFVEKSKALQKNAKLCTILQSSAEKNKLALDKVIE